MKQNNYKPQIPDVMEAIFDVAYLIFDLIAALLFFFFSQGNPLFILYGILTLTLCGVLFPWTLSTGACDAGRGHGPYPLSDGCYQG